MFECGDVIGLYVYEFGEFVEYCVVYFYVDCVDVYVGVVVFGEFVDVFDGILLGCVDDDVVCVVMCYVELIGFDVDVEDCVGV